MTDNVVDLQTTTAALAPSTTHDDTANQDGDAWKHEIAFQLWEGERAEQACDATIAEINQQKAQIIEQRMVLYTEAWERAGSLIAFRAWVAEFRPPHKQTQAENYIRAKRLGVDSHSIANHGLKRAFADRLAELGRNREPSAPVLYQRAQLSARTDTFFDSLTPQQRDLVIRGIDWRVPASNALAILFIPA